MDLVRSALGEYSEVAPCALATPDLCCYRSGGRTYQYLDAEELVDLQI